MIPRNKASDIEVFCIWLKSIINIRLKVSLDDKNKYVIDYSLKLNSPQEVNQILPEKTFFTKNELNNMIKKNNDIDSSSNRSSSKDDNDARSKEERIVDNSVYEKKVDDSLEVKKIIFSEIDDDNDQIDELIENNEIMNDIREEISIKFNQSRQDNKDDMTVLKNELIVKLNNVTDEMINMNHGIDEVISNTDIQSVMLKNDVKNEINNIKDEMNKMKEDINCLKQGISEVLEILRSDTGNARGMFW